MNNSWIRPLLTNMRLATGRRMAATMPMEPMPSIYPEQEWKPVFDKSKLFKLTTVFKSYDLLLTGLAAVLGGGLALSYMASTSSKEDAQVDKRHHADVDDNLSFLL